MTDNTIVPLLVLLLVFWVVWAIYNSRRADKLEAMLAAERAAHIKENLIKEAAFDKADKEWAEAERRMHIAEERLEALTGAK
jgi:uncharacterized protein YifN (PemK superfamily)